MAYWTHQDSKLNNTKILIFLKILLDLKKEKEANFNFGNEAVEAQKSISGPNEKADYKVLFFGKTFFYRIFSFTQFTIIFICQMF